MRPSFARLIAFGAPALLLLGFGCQNSFSPLPATPAGLSLAFIGMDGDVVTGIRQKHVIGKSACPTAIAPIWIEAKGDAHPPKAKPKTDAKWLTLPDEVTPGEWFIPRFNCDIDDFTPHVEEADITFDWEDPGATPTDGASEGKSDVGPGMYKGFGLKLHARMDVCTSDDACPPETEDAGSKAHGIDPVTWAKPCPSESACADKGADGGWFGTATEDQP